MPQSAKAKQSTRAPKLKPLTKFERLMNSRRIARGFVAGSLVVLLLTTCLWAIVGAQLQNDNADQLSDSYLFENANTAHGAHFPGQHTFLFKWPLFWLQHAFGYTNSGFVALTVFVVLLTVGGLVYLLWRIERRPFVFGLFCLALASVLLAVPPVPYPGALLPVNMAMLTTRNLEYLLYIVALVLVIGVKRARSARFAVAVGSLGLLFASDRLFGTLSLGGALIALVVYGLLKRPQLKQLAWHWLLASLGGLVIAAGVLSLLDLTGAVHIVSQSAATPYGLVQNLHAFVLGTVYVLFALLTNFGANPGYSATTLATTPHIAKTELLHIGGVAYAVNLCLLCIGLWCCLHVLRSSFRVVKTKSKKKPKPIRLAPQLATMLIFSTLVAVASYVLTNHYYLVDARYITIGLFAVFVSAATYSRTKLLQPKIVMIASAVLLLATLSGSYLAIHTGRTDSQALAGQRDRTSLIAAALTGHHTETLIGNYWRVLPLKLASQNKQRVLPLASCVMPRDTLISDAWRPDLQRQSFAYLLSFDSNDHDFADCTLDKVTAAYGKPNASTLIAGTNENPKELILFYDNGLQSSTNHSLETQLHTASSIRPVSPKNLKHKGCKGHRTIMQIVAHEDDDLLFMNPDLQHAIQAGDCIRTVYMTAGDAGAGKFYWLGREQGSEAAYGVLAHTSNFWVEQTVKFGNHEFASVATPANSDQFSLVFMHLPDGSPSGQGFPASSSESLAKLDAGSITSIATVDHQSYYSHKALHQVLETLIDVYQPDEIRTQLPYSANMTYVDHSDHTTVGRLVTEAYKSYKTTHPEVLIGYYVGYPIHAYEPNVGDDDLALKEQAFMAYSNFDGAACSSPQLCAESGVYDVYLTRQYRIDDLQMPQ